ncbi:MAG TPA: amino acid adenylation domain-containing protein [Pyrinomonadaceae bacterium]|nr:amino acid adenylation domain-containing protein [Pyrinomonadaceae bacterium]
MRDEQIIPRRSHGDGAPLSFAQERLWFLDQLDPGGAAYNLPGAVWLEGDLDVVALERSLNEIVRRHEILRTTFRTERGWPVQVIAGSLWLPLPLVDLSHLSNSDSEARRLGREESAKPFDLASGPLLRATLVRLSAECHLLLVTLHHIVADGWSVTLLVQELGTLYAAYRNGEQSSLRQLEITYADYAVWQREWLQGERLEERLGYWREQLGDELPVLKLPLAQPRVKGTRRRGALETVRVSSEVTQRLRELGRREGATLFMTLLAAWKVLLSRLSGEPDVVVGTPVAGRVSRELEPLIGFFVNTLVLRTELSDEQSFVEVLKRVREVCLEAYAHQEVPFERVVEELRPGRELNQAPLFQVLFALQNAPLPQLDLPRLRMRVEDATSDTAKFDLALEVTENTDELVCVWQYDADIFDAATVKRMAAHYQTLLAGVVADPTCEIHEVSLLNNGEARALLADHNNTHFAYPQHTLLHELFEEQAAITPEAIAILSENLSLSYAELNERANQVAHYLQTLGLPPEGRVGVLLERSADLVVALLGVLKAGGACVPLDPAYPSERLKLLIEDSRATVVLTHETLAQAALFDEEEVFSRKGAKAQSAAAFLPGSLCAFAPLRETAPSARIDPANVAYVIYTSGSSGKPKGVMVTHAALCNHMYWMRDAFALNEADVFLQKTPIGFDASVWEFYMPLMVGAKLVMAQPGGHQDSGYLVRTMMDHNVTVLQVVPTLLRMLVNQSGFDSCRNLRLVFCGGEALTKELAAQCLAALPATRVWNLYGPAETTIDATCWEATSWTNTTTVPIGKPVANAGAYVLDRWLNPVPLGVAGELYLDGAGLARGYEQHAELTAERFVPNPFRDEPGTRMYRTGDLVRRLPEGELEFLGRIDGQVKVRGSRVELGEVEAVLSAHADVIVAAVVAREDISGELRLVAYIVSDAKHDGLPRELREFLKERLPGHMVPSVFVRVEQLPLLPSGKVDRRALPAPDKFERTQQSDYRPPRTLVEETLCGIWEEVLGRDLVGADDDFFELGGHSLLATQVVSRVKEALSVELPLTRLFQTPVLSELAQYIEDHLRPSDHAEPPLQPVSREHPLPLSFAQQRLWFLDQLEPANPLYNTPGALRLLGRLDVTALGRALSEIVRRHETLRTTFQVVDGNPVQIISAPYPVNIPVIDLVTLDDVDRETRTLIDAEAKRPFDLSHGPLLRATLLRLREEEHLLLFTMHHIISDGWSVGVLAREAAKLYAAFTGQEASRPAEPPLQYADYAIWQREWLRGEALRTQFDYWNKQLEGLSPVLELPLDHPRPKARSLRGAFVPVEFNEELTLRLKALCRSEGATLFMTLLAAFQTLLSRYAGQQDVAVGVPLANRRRREIEDLIGFFVNTLVMRTNLTGDPTFRELLGRVREVALGAYAHQDVPFEMLVERFQPARDAGHTPFFNVLFVFQNTPFRTLELPGLTVEQLDVGTGTAKFDLMLSLEESAGRLTGIFEYSTDLFEEPTIRLMLGHFETLLGGIVQEPDHRISDLPLLKTEEEQRLVLEWNRTAADFPRTSCIHDLFYEQVTRTPDEVALISGDERLTYRELDHAANRLANFLRRHGVGTESVVAVATGRSTRMAVAVLAILKAGAAYLPLDPEYPHERLSFMLDDAHVSAVLTEQHLLDRLPRECPRVICLDTDAELIVSECDTNPASGVSAENLAYVIYTSGSTGRPKAVIMSHRAISNLVAFQFSSTNAKLRTLQFASLNFDVSVQEMFTTWCAGATLILIEEQTRRDAGALLRVVVEQRVERLFLPFVALQHLAEASEAEGIVPRDLREVITAGEQLKITPAIERLFAKLDGCHLDNHYGPTETHLATMWRLEGAAREWPRLPPIGGPIANVQVYVLDEHYRPVPPGVVGELYIGGEGLARGYFNRPGQTAERFVPNPFSSEPGGRLYKTGDLVRRFDERRLEYVGRSDRQVKVRGFRVEVGEIEATLKLHRDVRQAVVTDWDREDGRKFLAAYVVANGNTSVGDLKRLLRDHLPEYMVPAVFVRMEQLPLLPNGKVDRRALPPPNQMDHEGDYVVPRTPVEEVLCGIWEQVLGRERVGADDDFFELGGHSLLATQLISRVRQAFRIDVPLRSLFEHPTPARLGQVVESEIRAGREPLPPVSHVVEGPNAPLSFAQQRLWILDKLEPHSAAYNLPSALRLEGPLDVAALERSFEEIVRRHEVLRTTFAIAAGEPTQTIGPPVSGFLSFIDPSHLPDSESEARRVAREEAARPFDLTRGPLLRTTLVRLSPECHLLLVTLHHIVADGWSVTLLVQELSDLYAAYRRGEQSTLPELEVTYADYSVWQREWLQGERLEAQLAYWREQLRGELPALKLPLAQARVGEARRRGAVETVRAGSEVTQRLRELGRREGATLFMTLLAAWKVLLSRLSGERDVVVGTPVAGRVSRELEPLIGFFVNTLVLRTALEENANFSEVLKRVREVCLEAYANQEVPFERVVEELRPGRELNQSQLIQVLFALQNTPTYELALTDLKITVLEPENPAARFDLALEVSETNGELDCRFTYDADLFDAATIARLSQHFVNLLKAVATEPQQQVSRINFLGEEERRQLLPQRSTKEFANTCIHELFERRVELTPEATAVVFGAKRLSYRELNERADQLAHHLRSQGAGPEKLIGIAVERSLEMIAGVLAILKAGAAYVPLSPDTPSERLATLLQDAGIELLLTDKNLRDVTHHRDTETQREQKPKPASADNLAYLIYTSGSTGRPKGVQVTHRNLVHSTSARFIYYDKPVHGFMLVSPFFFDSSVAGIFWTLCQGGKLVLPPKDFERDPRALAALIEAEQVSHILCLPMVHSLLLRQAAGTQLDSLRCAIVAGEPCPPELPKQHFATLPLASLFNEYGPTEGTVWSTVHKCAASNSATTVPIGRPIPNAQTYVLDEHFQPVPIGVAGELYIGGEGIARGYRNNAAQTAERFVPHPYSTEPGARLYATGDLARHLPDGELEFLGRRDQQVKIRGHRIELGEIEAALINHSAVRDAVVVAVDHRLVAYFTGDKAITDELREFLRARLPEYMLPSQFVLLEAMPLSANGKVNRNALPAPGASRPALRASYAAPQTPLEQTIAAVWREFLQLDTVGVNDIFFELGGHSLLLVLVHETLQQRLEREVPIADLFKYPTVRALARHLGGNSPNNEEESLNRHRAGERRAALKARSKANTARNQ